jgi:hypothetical protein
MKEAAPDLSGLEVVHPRVATALRAKSGAERLRLAHESWELARERLGVFLARVHPDWDGEHIRREVARRLLGDSG